MSSLSGASLLNFDLTGGPFVTMWCTIPWEGVSSGEYFNSGLKTLGNSCSRDAYCDEGGAAATCGDGAAARGILRSVSA